ncbi:hypothetical protein NMH79_003602 [Vibrio cholerae]|nr:hypothetical protein [Vibrio cholerae]
MKLYDLLRGSLLSNVSFREAVNEQSDAIEHWAKWLVAGSVACYVVGLLIASLYFSGLSIRAFELLKPQYIFLGAIFIAFIYGCFIFPLKMFRKKRHIIIYQALTLLIVVLNGQLANYLYFLSGRSLLIFSSYAGVVIKSQAASAILYFFVVVFLVNFSRYMVENYNHKVFVTITLIVGFFFSISCFSTAIFPRIPVTLGGGDFPIVRITFSNDAPREITSQFDITSNVKGPVGFKYFAKLVYSDSSVVILKKVYWFGNEVLEIPRNMVVQFAYYTYNPAEVEFKEEVK